MANYAKMLNKKDPALTARDKKLPGRKAEQVRNAAGGVSFRADPFTMLRRFLIIGTEGNGFYQSQKKLFSKNVKALTKCLKIDPIEVVDMVVDVSHKSLAIKQEPAIFVLSVVASYNHDFPYISITDSMSQTEVKDAHANNELHALYVTIRQYALDHLQDVARTGTSLYMFANFVKEQRGWGRGLRRAFNNWMNNMPVNKLAYQSWKYKSRAGWRYRDIMRLCHPLTDNPIRSEIFTYMAESEKNPSVLCNPGSFGSRLEHESAANTGIYTQTGKVRKRAELFPLHQIVAAEQLLKMEKDNKSTVSKAVNLIVDFSLTHESVPTQLRKNKEIWEALLQTMPLNAVVRNLGLMTSIGLITTFSDAQKHVSRLLTTQAPIIKSRAHPMKFFIAAKQYASGHANYGDMSWTPDQLVLDSLDEAFHLSFGNVAVTNKNIVVALDTSGSMVYGQNTAVYGTSNAELGLAMALVTLRVEPNSILIGYDTELHDLKISKNATLLSLLSNTKFPGRGTDTSLPMQYVLKHKIPADAVISYTDNMTWETIYYHNNGIGHVTQLVEKHAEKYPGFVNINCAMEANSATDTDSKNTNMFELVGLSADTPTIISQIVDGL